MDVNPAGRGGRRHGVNSDESGDDDYPPGRAFGRSSEGGGDRRIAREGESPRTRDLGVDAQGLGIDGGDAGEDDFMPPLPPGSASPTDDALPSAGSPLPQLPPEGDGESGGEVFYHPIFSNLLLNSDGERLRNIDKIRPAPGRSATASSGDDFIKSIINRLHGETDADDALTPEESFALKLAIGVLGEDEAETLASRLKTSDTHNARLTKTALAYALRNANLEQPPPASSPAMSHAAQSDPRTQANVLRIVGEIVAAVRLGAHFDDLERRGGAIVRQAEETVRRFLHEGAATSAAASITELVRDLRSGAFLPTNKSLAQFPLTNHARVASEMMALMRTLDRLEQIDGRFASDVRRTNDDSAAASRHLAAASAPRRPRLPGRAGTLEIDRSVRLLYDANAKQTLYAPSLRAGDGTPLKPGELLWLGAAGGSTRTPDGEPRPATPSPALADNLDALYSLVGFDGRAPQTPAFLLVRAEINHAKPDALFGQAPFTDGWTRALIERLKNSFDSAHNRLGEELEDALACNQFNRVVLRGAIEEGVPVADSFTLAPATRARNATPHFAFA